MSIIGIILGVVAISLFVWIKKEQQMNFNLHDGDIEAAKHAFNALMDDLNHYQIETDRKIAELEKQLEIKTKSAERRMDNMNKSLPSVIGTVVGQIEFAQDKINRQV
jgi:predicted Holliday junction resolvase-like endonuclease